MTTVKMDLPGFVPEDGGEIPPDLADIIGRHAMIWCLQNCADAVNFQQTSEGLVLNFKLDEDAVLFKLTNPSKQIWNDAFDEWKEAILAKMFKDLSTKFNGP